MLIGIPVYEDVDLLDVTGPFEMFTWADGVEVELVAQTPGPNRCNGGLVVQVERCSPTPRPMTCCGRRGASPKP